MFSKISFVVMLCVSVIVACANSAKPVEESRAHWLCYPEPFSQGLNKPRFFRKSMTVKHELASAKLYCVIDDVGAVFVNGSAVPPKYLFHPTNPLGYEVKDLLVKGQNTLAFSVTNLAGSGGFICRLELVFTDGSFEEIVSDTSWNANLSEVAGWSATEFDDSAWIKPQITSDAHAPPWTTLCDMTTLLTQEEQKAIAETRKLIQKQFVKIKARLAEETKPQCKIRYTDGKAQIMIGTRPYEPTLYMGSFYWAFDNPAFLEKIEAFRRGGIHLYGIGVDMKRIWKSDNSLDLSAVDDLLLNALRLDPEGYYLLCFYMSVAPSWWNDSHPDDLVEYANGDVDPSTTDALSRFKAPSLASKVWRRDLGDALRRIVEHVEQSPLANRIFGYRPDYGVYAEWHYYGMANGMPDTGKAMTAAFRDWLRQNYPDETALHKAWNSSEVGFDNAQVPNKEERLDDKALSLRDPIANRKTADFMRCLSEEVKDCLLHCNRAIKEACGRRALVGNYCGYFFGMPFPAEGWHLSNEAILDSPDVDFQSSPFCYSKEFRALGESQQARSLVETYRLRGKLCILEADSRTHLEPDHGHTFATNAAQSVATLARDFCQALTLGCGVWYLDFGLPWYNDPLIFDFFGKIQSICQMPADCRSAAEVVVVGDFESVIYHGTEQHPLRVNHTAIDAVVRELGHTGVPFDTLSFGDLQRNNLKEYKVYILPNLYYVTPEKRAVVNTLKRNNKTLVWLFAPGYLTDKGLSLESMSELTGMRIRVLHDSAVPETKALSDDVVMRPFLRNTLGPLFSVDDPKATVLGTFQHGDETLNTFAHKTCKGYKSYLCSTAFVTRQEFRKLFAASKVHIYSDDNDSVVYANRSFVAFHTHKGGTRTLKLPHSATVQRLLPDRSNLGQGLNEITFHAPPNSTTLFYCRKRLAHSKHD